MYYLLVSPSGLYWNGRHFTGLRTRAACYASYAEADAERVRPELIGCIVIAAHAEPQEPDDDLIDPDDDPEVNPREGWDKEEITPDEIGPLPDLPEPVGDDWGEPLPPLPENVVLTDTPDNAVIVDPDRETLDKVAQSLRQTNEGVVNRSRE